MHEFSIIDSIFKIIQQESEKHQLKSLKKVTIKIGKLRQCFPDFLQFAFETLSSGTIAENAKLIIIEVPIKMFCKTCEKTFFPEHNTYICPYCKSADLSLLEGKEVELVSIEGEK